MPRTQLILGKKKEKKAGSHFYSVVDLRQQLWKRNMMCNQTWCVKNTMLTLLFICLHVKILDSINWCDVCDV
jgi:hypothetical protein